MKFYKILFFITLMSGTLISISAYSWMSMWIGLEINLLSMIPLLNSMKNIYPSESALKYFISQALASALLMFSIIMQMNMNEFMPQNSNMLFMMILNSAFLIKLGAAPFHWWFPEVMEGLNWVNCLIMLTWQKIAPMVLMMYTPYTSGLFTFTILASTIVGGIMGINQISIRKIMAYSSINHIAWMIASMLTSQSIWFIYFLVYSIISCNIIMIFKFLNVFYLNQFFTVNLNKTMKMFFMLNFLSLGGLPPFLGFFPKWLTINKLVENNFFMLSVLLTIFTLLTLFFYLRITFSALTINSNESLMTQNMKVNFMVLTTNFISLSGIIIATLIFNLY